MIGQNLNHVCSIIMYSYWLTDPCSSGVNIMFRLLFCCTRL
jgi:hypothetical protein